MGKLIGTLGAAALFLSLTGATGGGQVLLDGTAAVIAAKVPSAQSVSVITLWELEAHCRVESVKRFGPSGVSRPVSKALRAEVLADLVVESVLAMELGRIGFKNLDEGKVGEEVKKLAETLGGEEEFFNEMQKLGITRTLVSAWVALKLLVGAYVEVQLRMTASGKSPGGAEASAAELLYFRSSLVEELKKKYHIWIFIKEN